MKKYALFIAGVLILVQACKKDKDDMPVTASTYRLTAPQCLIEKAKIVSDGEVTSSVYTYDGLRRIVSVKEQPGGDATTYVYSGNTITEEYTEIQPDGSSVKTVSVHYLNVSGFIEKTVKDDSSTILYSYNSEGYLTREIGIDEEGRKVYGTSHQYSNGNKIISYDLKVDFLSGEITDSTESIKYYYSDLPGKIEEWGAWSTRLGRGSKNEIKSQSGGFSTAAFEYTIAPNGLPSALDLTHIFGTIHAEFTWKCN